MSIRLCIVNENWLILSSYLSLSLSICYSSCRGRCTRGTFLFDTLYQIFEHCEWNTSLWPLQKNHWSCIRFTIFAFLAKCQVEVMNVIAPVPRFCNLFLFLTCRHSLYTPFPWEQYLYIQFARPPLIPSFCPYLCNNLPVHV